LNNAGLLTVFLSCLTMAGCNGESRIPWTPVDDNGWRETKRVSVDVHQGYTTNGTDHFLFHTDRVDRFDAAWNPAAEKSFRTLGRNHLGDGDYYNGKLYLAVEDWHDDCQYQNQAIMVLNSDSLAVEKIVDISANGHEVSGLTVVPGDNAIYSVSYCQSDQIWKYDLTTFDLVDVLVLSEPISRIQGIAFDGDRGIFYVSANKAVYEVSFSGRVSIAFRHPYSDYHEGLDYLDNTIRLLIDNDGDRRLLEISRK